MHRAQIQEFVAECIALLLLREDVLQREGEFAKADCFRPFAVMIIVACELEVRKESETAVRAFFKASLKLICEDLAQCLELYWVDCVFWIHGSNARFIVQGLNPKSVSTLLGGTTKVVPRHLFVHRRLYFLGGVWQVGVEVEEFAVG